MPGEPPRVQPSKKVVEHWDEPGGLYLNSGVIHSNGTGEMVIGKNSATPGGTYGVAVVEFVLEGARRGGESIVFG